MEYEKHFIETSPSTRLCIRAYPPIPSKITQPFPIILVHGLLNSSELFDVPGLPDFSLARSLAEQGFAVYAYDQRGSGESSTADWNFGLKENALTDLPLVIQFCLGHSGQEKVTLGGYSLGGLIIYCFYTHLIKSSVQREGISKDNINKIFTIASPGEFHQRKGRWRYLFSRAESMLRAAGPCIDRDQFIQGQIYIYNPALGKLISRSMIRKCIRIAGKGPIRAALVKALPVPSFLYSNSDFDANTFQMVIRSKALDRTSTKIFHEIFRFASQNGSVNVDTDNTIVSLPDDFRLWRDMPILLVSSVIDELVLSSEVEVVHRNVSSSIYLNLDTEFGRGCGHAGYVFKRDVTKLVRQRLHEFLMEG